MRNDAPVLLVEDDAVDVGNVQRAFAKNGIGSPVYVVRNGEEAIAFLRGRTGSPHLARRPGLILLDLNMPMMDGFEFLAHIKHDEDLRKIPVVVLTSSHRCEDRVRSFELGAAGYILKPNDSHAYVKLIETLDAYWTLSELSY